MSDTAPAAAPASASSSPANGPTPGRIALSPLWLLFAAVALAIPGVVLVARGTPALPVLATLPDFTLTDQTGAPFGKQQLIGKVWMADFVFTSCPEACPRLTGKMRGLQDKLTAAEEEKIGLVSISVDPERDSPAVLRAYAAKFGAKEPLWRFLTGSQTEVERAVVEGFKIGVEKVPVPPAPTADDIHNSAFEILHGEKFVLVDALGRIRAYYDVGEQAGLDKLLADARGLLRSGAGR
jgi:protein SCO1/2